MAEIEHAVSDAGASPRRDLADTQAAARRERSAGGDASRDASRDADAAATDGHTTPGAGMNADLTDRLTADDGWAAGDMNPSALLPP